MQTEHKDDTAAAAVKGRPRITGQRADKLYSSLGVKVRRSQTEFYWSVRALAALGLKIGTTGEYSWLLNESACRTGLLAELGRLEDPDEIRAVATVLCAEKPKTKHGVAVLRGSRLNRRRQLDAKQLWMRLAAALDREIEQAPETSDETIVRAVRLLLLSLEREQSEEQSSDG